MLKNEHILIYIEKLSTPVSVVEKTQINTKTFTTRTKSTQDKKNFCKKIFTKTFVCVIMKITLTIQTIRDRKPTSIKLLKRLAD